MRIMDTGETAINWSHYATLCLSFPVTPQIKDLIKDITPLAISITGEPHINHPRDPNFLARCRLSHFSQPVWSADREHSPKERLTYKLVDIDSTTQLFGRWDGHNYTLLIS